MPITASDFDSGWVDYARNKTTIERRRGKHRLFKYRPDLPESDKNNFKIGELEFRTGNGGKGAQSVFPPSIHPSGAEYKWLISPEETDFKELSDEFLAAISAAYSEKPAGEESVVRTNRDWLKIIRDGILEGLAMKLQRV